ncbi:cell division protein FtsK (plasmid) [Sutcliffiella horikoshii]|uniref:FtsK/SpoIIIE domain-containing protein n=1 Tax=Sutcliffiella horikoshii TaxID=79883 RepID=UPI001CBC4DFC|nr:FtsK/SpoIIIE domain-containing protein [Sutcliffiella horikoshii]UAL49735.1 cell division protein FtsK [Sutcliffiella horikoshii]
MVKQWLVKQRAKGQLLQAFKAGEIGIPHKTGEQRLFRYPKINDIRFNYERKTLTYVFTLPYGVDPKILKKKEYVFQQFFSKSIELKGEIKTFTLTVFVTQFPNEVKYDYAAMKLKGKLPIPVGLDTNGAFYFYDMVKNPHLLIAGETGSGKSTQARSIITTLIQHLPPEDLHLYLCDLKLGDFHIFRKVEHVKSFDTEAVGLKTTLLGLKKLMKKRGMLLLKHEVSHIDDVPGKQPYIILAIDEVALLKKEKECMEIVEEISSIGRALGVFLILSMQRPDAKLLDGKLKINLTVRMAFRSADGINSRIVIDKVGAEKLEQTGRMLLKIQSERELKEIQAPYLTIEGAKMILEGYKVQGEENLLEAKNEPLECEELERVDDWGELDE